MADSGEAFAAATAAVRQATGCSTVSAERVVNSIAAYISRFSAEIISRSGPAHEWAKSRGI